MKAEIRMIPYSQGTPEIASKPPEAREEAGNRFLLTVHRRNQPNGHLDFGLLAS